MTFWTLISRSLRFHARSHLGALLGATVGSAVLIGALAVGDSVRESLREMALARLGKTQFALMSNDRFFRDKLASDLGKTAHSALQLPGSASKPDSSSRANKIQIIGVGQDFVPVTPRHKEKLGKLFDDLPLPILGLKSSGWRQSLWKINSFLSRSFHMPMIVPVRFSPVKSIITYGWDEDARMSPQPDGVYLNTALAKQLHAAEGDTILLRVQKPSFLSRDAPISPQEDSSVVLRLKVEEILSDRELGRFSLQANQIAPFNAFVRLPMLQKRLDLPQKANLLLSDSAQDPNPLLQKNWQLADAQLELRTLTNGSGIELRSERIFLDEAVVRAADKIKVQSYLNFDGLNNERVTSILTYFVNELRVATNSTPYSMVTAAESPLVPAEMRDDEILINQWLADDLQAKAGDELQLKYFVLGPKGLEEKTNSFRVRGIVPLEGIYADRELMPEFPGLAKAEKTENWDAGFPIDMKKIRPKDEQYWKDFRGTPKAFVTLSAGQKMWSNRFGNLTAIRFPQNASTDIETALLKNLNPASFGLSFLPVREHALAASSQSQDFGQLFLGFSFFLILAALLLMAMLFQFGLEQRSTEIGLLLALGFTPKKVRRLFLGEGILIGLIGGILGVFGGIFYAKAMLLGLTTIWRAAIGTSALHFYITPASLVIGLVSSVVLSAIIIWLALRNQAKRPASELLANENIEFQISNSRSGKINVAKWIFMLGATGAFALIGSAIFKQETTNPGIFFGGGALLLLSGLAGAVLFLKKLGSSTATQKLSLAAMGLRGCTRRRKRSVATISLLASGCFLIVAVSANKLDSDKDSRKRSSGTGGFALVGETTLPVVKNLNEKVGREFFGLDEKKFSEIGFVQMRVRDGDEASCLNLNRAQTPRLLGINPEELQSRVAFTFARAAKGFNAKNQWSLLKNSSENEIAAIGDAASIQYALGKKVGDTLDYLDERGNRFKIRIVASVANSILQGSLLIDEQAFIKKFPSESGYRMFLIDAPSKDANEISAELSRAMQDFGLELTPASQRLAAFNAVKNTYLNTFQVLGGLGLLLGSVGLGVVVLRNVLERRSELAVLKAVGFQTRSLRWLILSEHGALLLCGLGLGILAALIAILPTLLSPGKEMSYRSLAWTIGAVFCNGLLWTWLATKFALRGELLKALRNE